MNWTPRELSTVMAGQKNGLSGAQIAKELPGRSRCAVIAKLWRKGLSPQGVRGRHTGNPGNQSHAQRYCEAVRRQIEALGT